MALHDRSRSDLPSTDPASDAPRDARMEVLIGDLLFSGVVISASLLLTGLLWNAVKTGRLRLDYTIEGRDLYRFALKELREVLTTPKPRLILNLGVVVLMFTPFLRVVTSVLYFAVVERSLKYTLIAGVVLAILAYSLLLR